MPEKPEVMTVCSVLKKRIIGKTITDCNVYWNNIIATDLNSFKKNIINQKINSLPADSPLRSQVVKDIINETYISAKNSVFCQKKNSLKILKYSYNKNIYIKFFRRAK